MTVKSCEKVEKSQVELTIEVNAAEFEAAVEKAYQKMRRKISVPGFRPGKAPRKMIERMYGAEVFFEEAINIAFPEAYEAAAEQEKLQIVGYPTVEMVGEVTKDGFTFKATTPVYPEVTLGEYKGLEVSVDTVEVDEDEWDSLVNNVYYENITAENGGIMDRAVETGDTVNIDYEGKKDDVAFDGGTAQGYDLTIGSGSFIAGFEDGLIGVMPGETVDLNLTFPENYGKSDLAGQAVVFTVTVNYIQPAQDGEFSDEVISNFGIDGVTNEEELRQYAYDYLNENAQQNYETNVQQAVMDAFMANNTFTSVPEALVQKYSDAAESSITSMASSYGVDADTFTQYYYGQDLASFLATYSEEAAKQDIALQAVANRENLNISDEELDQILLDRATAAGYDTIEEYIGETSKEDYREYFLYDKVTDYLVENAKITNN